MQIISKDEYIDFLRHHGKEFASAFQNIIELRNKFYWIHFITLGIFLLCAHNFVEHINSKFDYLDLLIEEYFYLSV